MNTNVLVEILIPRIAACALTTIKIDHYNNEESDSFISQVLKLYNDCSMISKEGISHFKMDFT